MVSEVVLDWTCSPTGHGFELNSPEPTELEDLGLHIIKVQSCGEMSPSLMRTEITQMTVNKCVKEAGSYCGHWARSCQRDQGAVRGVSPLPTGEMGSCHWVAVRIKRLKQCLINCQSLYKCKCFFYCHSSALSL